MHEIFEAVIEDYDHDDGRDESPGEFEGGVVLGGFTGDIAGPVAVHDGERHEEDGDEEEEENADAIDPVVEAVDFRGDGGGLGASSSFPIP